MSLHHVRWFSPALGKQSEFHVIVPDGPGPHRVVHQLHGLSDDCSIWLRRTSIERYAAERKLMVVLHDGGRSFYLDWPGNLGNWEQHILQAIAHVDATFRTRAERGGRAIGGLSMGGWGALRLGLKHRERFASVAAHSAVCELVERQKAANWPELALILRDGLPPDCDLRALARRSGPLPALRIDCGTEDFLIEDNRALHRDLTALGVPHRYEEHPGAHTWAYWDQHVQAALDFHVQNLGA